MLVNPLHFVQKTIVFFLRRARLASCNPCRAPSLPSRAQRSVTNRRNETVRNLQFP
jgi:hypothetical protein